jgi:hypothetical protein
VWDRVGNDQLVFEQFYRFIYALLARFEISVRHVVFNPLWRVTDLLLFLHGLSLRLRLGLSSEMAEIVEWQCWRIVFFFLDDWNQAKLHLVLSMRKGLDVYVFEALLHFGEEVSSSFVMQPPHLIRTSSH